MQEILGEGDSITRRITDADEDYGIDASSHVFRALEDVLQLLQLVDGFRNLNGNMGTSATYIIQFST